MYTFIFEHTSVKRVPLTLSELNKHEYSFMKSYSTFGMPVNQRFRGVFSITLHVRQDIYGLQ